MNICVYGAASETIDRRYIEAAEELGAAIAKRGHTLVFGGGAWGLMGGAARGAHRGKRRHYRHCPALFRYQRYFIPGLYRNGIYPHYAGAKTAHGRPLPGVCYDARRYWHV